MPCGASERRSRRYILHSWSLVKIGTTGAQKKLFFKLRRLKGQLRAIDDGDLRPDQVALIADMLSVSKQDVISMNGLLSASDRSLNVPVYQDSEEQWQDWLADEADSQGIAPAEHEELFTRKALLFDAFKVLSKRERQILIKRRLKDDAVKLDVLAQQYNVSREGVRQIEVCALTKLQETMKAGMMARTVRTECRADPDVDPGHGHPVAEERAGRPGSGGRPIQSRDRYGARGRPGTPGHSAAGPGGSTSDWCRIRRLSRPGHRDGHLTAHENQDRRRCGAQFVAVDGGARGSHHRGIARPPTRRAERLCRAKGEPCRRASGTGRIHVKILTLGDRRLYVGKSGCDTAAARRTGVADFQHQQQPARRHHLRRRDRPAL